MSSSSGSFACVPDGAGAEGPCHTCTSLTRTSAQSPCFNHRLGGGR